MLSMLYIIYIDANSIIYDVINYNINNNNDTANNYDELIIKKTIDKVNDIINEINPKNGIIVAFDGIPPIAKMYQQRKRI